MSQRVVLLSLLTAATLTACGVSQSAPSAQDGWARAADKGQNSAAYFTLNNPGLRDRVIAVQSEISDQISLHETVLDEQGVAKMQSVEAVDLPAHATIEFKPGGMHVMLMSLKRSLEPGDRFSISLILERAGRIDVPIEVRAP